MALAVALAGVTASPASAGYTFAQVVDVPVTYNQQGLAYADGVHYVSFDRDGTHGQIIGYDGTGRKVDDSGVLPLGHAAEVSFRQADGNLYVATGGETQPTYVNVVDMRPAPPAIVRRYDFSALGPNGLVAIDNRRDRMLVFTGRNAAGRWVFTWSDFSGRTTPAFTLADGGGLPQGLELVGDQILFFTSTLTPSGSWTNSILVLGLTGAVVQRIPVPGPYEGEGLSTDLATHRVHVGYLLTNRVDRMSPVLTAPLGTNLLSNPGAESGTGATAAAVLPPLPSWRASGMTARRWSAGAGAGAGHPTAAGPGPTGRGALFFSGGTRSTGTMTQDLPLSGLPAADVDAGRLRYALRGWLGGYQRQEDHATVVATFLDRSGGTVGTAQIGPVTATDRKGVTGLLSRSRSATLPRGTRSVRVVVTGTRLSGTNLNAYADGLSLQLTRP